MEREKKKRHAARRNEKTVGVLLQIKMRSTARQQRRSSRRQKVFFQHHGHYITQNFDLSSLTGHFLKNIFILFLIKIYGFNYACKSKGIMV